MNLRTATRPTTLGKYTVPLGTNTLYVTNLEWLAATFPGQYQGIVTGGAGHGQVRGIHGQAGDRRRVSEFRGARRLRRVGDGGQPL